MWIGYLLHIISQMTENQFAYLLERRPQLSLKLCPFMSMTTSSESSL